MANDSQLPAQLPDLPEEHTVRMQAPDGRTYAVPGSKVEAAKAAGAKPAWTTTEALLAGLGQGASLGFGDEILGGGAGAAAGASALLHGKGLSGAADEAAHAYTDTRDDVRSGLHNAHEQHPYATGAGELVGSAAPALLLPGGLAGVAAQGAAAGLGNSEADTVGGLAKDAAIGGAIGGALHVGAGAAGRLLTKGADAAAAQAPNAVLHAAEINGADLGARSGNEARDVARNLLNDPDLVPKGFGKRVTADKLAENALKTRRKVGEALDQHYSDFDAVHGPTLNQRQVARAIRDHVAGDVSVNPKQLNSHVTHAIRNVNPDAFDARAEMLGNSASATRAAHAANPTPESLRAAQIAHQAVAAAKADPSLLLPNKNIGLQDTQQIMNRLKQLGAHSSTQGLGIEQASPVKAVYTPAWNRVNDLMHEVSLLKDPNSALNLRTLRDRYGLASNVAEAVGPKAAANVGKGALGDAAVGAAVGHVIGGPVGALAGGVAGGSKHVIGRALAPIIPGALSAAPAAAQRVTGALAAAAPVAAQAGAQGAATRAEDPAAKKARLHHIMMETSGRYRDAYTKRANGSQEKAAEEPANPDD